MLTLISPAKTLDFSSPWKVSATSQPTLLAEAAQLVAALRTKSPKQLMKLMEISDKLAAENQARFATWTPEHSPENAKPALLAYRGDVYLGLEADKFSPADLKFAQTHLRILTGLYGVLRPLDLIQPYRLEMGVPLKVGRQKNLYEFWGEKITANLHSALRAAKTSTVINLASQEYTEAVDWSALNGEAITPTFKDVRNGKLVFLSFFAKKARGAMAAEIIRQRITRPEELKKLEIAGYSFNSACSSSTAWTFTKPEV